MSNKGSIGSSSSSSNSRDVIEINNALVRRRNQLRLVAVFDLFWFALVGFLTVILLIVGTGSGSSTLNRLYFSVGHLPVALVTLLVSLALSLRARGVWLLMIGLYVVLLALDVLQLILRILDLSLPGSLGDWVFLVVNVVFLFISILYLLFAAFYWIQGSELRLKNGVGLGRKATTSPTESSGALFMTGRGRSVPGNGVGASTVSLSSPSLTF